MNEGLYEILSLAARYFFAVLFLLIVLRAWRITIKDSRRAKMLRRWAPETGLSGELVVMEGDGRAQRGMRYPVIREGEIGSARTADVRIRSASIWQKHARFELTERGLMLTARSGAKLMTQEGNLARRVLMGDGDSVYIGRVLLMLILIDATGREGTRREDEGLFDVARVRPISEEMDADMDPFIPERSQTREGRPVRLDEPWPTADDMFDIEDDIDEDLF